MVDTQWSCPKQTSRTSNSAFLYYVKEQTIGKGAGGGASMQASSTISTSRSSPVLRESIHESDFPSNLNRSPSSGFHCAWSRSWALWRNKNELKKISLS